MEGSPRKESITLKAIDIVHEMGFQGLTTREIAKREGISEAAIYRHFKNRDEIVAAVVAYYAKFDHNFVESINDLQLSPLESIVSLLERMAAYYEEYPAISSIMNAFDSMQYDAAMAETTAGIYLFRKTAVEDLLRQAQEDGALSRDVDPGLFSSILWSAFFSQVYEWRGCGRAFSLQEQTAAAIGMLLRLATEKTG
ncbi:TetR/AcrR family transcriptional regulator [Paenibacillus antri]|uniref:TetR/AcrR family transcriptional regulator n=1 Tax=Paenibacillus antri TaxID=2582848 RepID=A0A5R9G5G0_9BACL|nr:TetR/AcrR family transcriptional regulator [Paenibacillus antri]TLS49370.1 TetR/AcrR family transcriptional regulator [Paenibacillus antri]